MHNGPPQAGRVSSAAPQLHGFSPSHQDAVCASLESRLIPREQPDGVLVRLGLPHFKPGDHPVVLLSHDDHVGPLPRVVAKPPVVHQAGVEPQTEGQLRAPHHKPIARAELPDDGKEVPAVLVPPDDEGNARYLRQQVANDQASRRSRPSLPHPPERHREAEGEIREDVYQVDRVLVPFEEEEARQRDEGQREEFPFALPLTRSEAAEERRDEGRQEEDFKSGKSDGFGPEPVEVEVTPRLS